MTEISIVVPLLNESQSLDEIHHRLVQVLERLGRTFEIIYIDDGSTDGSLDILRTIHSKDRRVKVVSFRRTYGKSAALAVGFEEAQGEIVVTIDADLQDDPDEIPALIEKLESGYDLVSGWKKHRKDPISKTLPSRVFNLLVRLVTGLKLHDINCGLKVYRREVTSQFKLYGQLHRFLPIFAFKEGYRVGEVVVKHHPRRYGKTKYGVRRFQHGILDLMTVVLITSYLKTPLHFFGSVGLLFFLAGFGINCYILSVFIEHGNIRGHHPLLMLGVLLMILGFQLVSTGLLAELMTRISHRGKEEYSVKVRLSNQDSCTKRDS
ncbi:MAG: glycosyltransferase family 2 protein [bacterium]